MARSLKFLESLPQELQEKVLEELSINKSSSLEDIEIDGKMYKAHKAVLDLIDGLVLQMEILEKLNSKLRKKVGI